MPAPNEIYTRSKAHVVFFNGIKFRRYPNARSAAHRNYFKPSGNYTKRGVGALHVEIWKACHGPVPTGHHIHHIDGNTLNNSIDNLECLTPEQHSQKHFTSPARLERARKHMENIRPLASAWHRSEEGREFHQRNGVESWEDRDHRELNCSECNIVFRTRHLGDTRFCSNKCKAKSRRKSGVDHIEKVCPFCGTTFMSCRYKGSNTCSRLCGQRSRTDRGA